MVCTARRPFSILTRSTCAHGDFHGTGDQLSQLSRQIRKYGGDIRAEVGGRIRRDGTGRDHGYPGGRARPPRYQPAADAEVGR